MEPDVKSEIGEMLKSFGAVEDNSGDDKDQNDDKDVNNEGEGESDNEGSDSNDNESDESDKGEPGEGEGEDKDDKSNTEGDNEPDEKDKIIEDLRTKLAEKENVKEPETDKEEVKEPEPIKFEDQDFVGDLDVEELVRDPGEFNKLLNKIYQKAVTDTRQILGEGVLRSIPDIVKTNIEVMTNLKKASEKFYEDNKDLKPFKKVVAAVFEEIASESPGKKYDEVLSKVGDEVRKRLDLKKTAVKSNANDGERVPKLPRKKGSAGTPDNKPDTSSLQDDISRMNKTLGR